MNDQMEQNEKLMKTAFSLFHRYGIRSISMDDLAREMGVSKKTIYQLIENKADLVDRLGQAHCDHERNGIARIQEHATDAMQELMEIARYSIAQFREVTPTMLYDLQKYYTATWKRVEKLYNEFFYKVMLRNLEMGREQGLYRHDFDCEIVARLFMLKTTHIADNDFFPLHEYSLDKLIQENFSYHINGVASHAGRARMRELLEQPAE